jgi:hypothetical protein
MILQKNDRQTITNVSITQSSFLFIAACRSISGGGKYLIFNGLQIYKNNKRHSYSRTGFSFGAALLLPIQHLKLNNKYV